ncbi:MAG: endonuclease [Candidatus Paceibacterota bacterium]
MEGPSLFLAQQRLKPFKGQTIKAAVGNTKAIEPGSLKGLAICDIFAWGKHLVFQFDTFAIRIHFMLFGTYEAEVEKEWVTGDYRRAREPRLAFTFSNGQINMYSCSVKILETKNAKKEYDFSIDTMSKKWDPARAYKSVRAKPDEQIADVLLDQEIFAGVGNIIKNEVLSRMKIAPQHKVGDLSPAKIKAIVKDAQVYSHLFYKWRKAFELRKHYQIYQKGVCPYCGGKVTRAKTGRRERWSYWCPIDQK